ncbi:unnamed protein product [Leptosia nina]|uniref:Uncharacterized protein n=1 Tax=Leptosia nina TaxID=320188 RepID=A0AAV1JD71_9NEOP
MDIEKKREWVLCPSKSFPGYFYYFNVLNGATFWRFNDLQFQKKNLDKDIPKVDTTHNYPEPSNPPKNDVQCLSSNINVDSTNECFPTSCRDNTAPSNISNVNSWTNRKDAQTNKISNKELPTFGNTNLYSSIPKPIATPNWVFGEVSSIGCRYDNSCNLTDPFANLYIDRGSVDNFKSYKKRNLQKNVSPSKKNKHTNYFLPCDLQSTKPNIDQRSLQINASGTNSLVLENDKNICIKIMIQGSTHKADTTQTQTSMTNVFRNANEHTNIFNDTKYQNSIFSTPKDILPCPRSNPIPSSNSSLESKILNSVPSTFKPSFQSAFKTNTYSNKWDPRTLNKWGFTHGPRCTNAKIHKAYSSKNNTDNFETVSMDIENSTIDNNIQGENVILQKTKEVPPKGYATTDTYDILPRYNEHRAIFNPLNRNVEKTRQNCQTVDKGKLEKCENFYRQKHSDTSERRTQNNKSIHAVNSGQTIRTFNVNQHFENGPTQEGGIKGHNILTDLENGFPKPSSVFNDNIDIAPKEGNNNAEKENNKRCGQFVCNAYNEIIVIEDKSVKYKDLEKSDLRFVLEAKKLNEKGQSKTPIENKIKKRVTFCLDQESDSEYDEREIHFKSGNNLYLNKYKLIEIKFKNDRIFKSVDYKPNGDGNKDQLYKSSDSSQRSEIDILNECRLKKTEPIKKSVPNLNAQNLNSERGQITQANEDYTIDNFLKTFDINNPEIEERVKLRFDEWVCCFVQIMQDFFEEVLQHESAATNPPGPWSFDEILSCIDDIFKGNVSIFVDKILEYYRTIIFRYHAARNNVNPNCVTKMIGSGLLFLEQFKIISPNYNTEASTKLSELLHCIYHPESESEFESLDIPTQTQDYGDSPTRPKMHRKREDILDYLKNHFETWRDCTIQDIEDNNTNVIRTFGRCLNSLIIDKNNNMSFQNGCVQNERRQLSSDSDSSSDSSTSDSSDSSSSSSSDGKEINEKDLPNVYGYIQYFLSYIYRVLNAFYMFVSESTHRVRQNSEDELLRSEVDEKLQYINYFIDNLKMIIDRESKGPDLKALLAKYEAALKDPQIVNYKSLVGECMEQAELFKKVLKIISKILNDSDSSVSTFREIKKF